MHFMFRLKKKPQTKAFLTGSLQKPVSHSQIFYNAQHLDFS